MLYFLIPLISQLTYTPPLGAYFWEVVATIFGGILLWLAKRDLDRRDRKNDQVIESINRLNLTVALMQQDVAHIREDLDTVKKDV